jgi:Tol biopolymer transport system component
MTTNSALSASLRSLRLRRLLAGVSVLAFAAVAFTGSPAWGETREKIVFTNTCIFPTECSATEAALKAEIYMMDPDGSNPIRLTNDGFGDGLAALSPDGKGQIVFDSNRIAIPDPVGTPFDSDLFLLNPAAAASGVPKPPLPLTRGSSASFDPSGKNIVYHRSESGGYGTRIRRAEGTPLRSEPGGPTTDSDIFLVNLEDLLEGGEPVNLTNGLSGLTSTPGVRGPYASDDADWSPDGKWIAFTSRIPCLDTPASDCLLEGKFAASDHGIYVMNLETKRVTKLTNLKNDGTEERSPAWSPDSTRIAIGRRPPPRDVQPLPPFEIWVLHFDPETVTVTNEIPLGIPGIASSWSPTGREIVGCAGFPPEQICVMNADGSNPHGVTPDGLPGNNFFAKWGRITVGHDPQ